jgi:shikimate kinase
MKVQSVQPEPTQPAAAPAKLRRIVLTGFMGAGKTTVGRELAERIGWEFLDLDALIEARAAATVPAIFAAHGEAQFRRLESQALAEALGRDNIVLALGGGAPETLTNRLLLEQTPATATIFLDAAFSVLYDRCMLQALSIDNSASAAQLRPVLADPAVAESRFLARRPIYRRLAAHVIDTTTLSTSEAVIAVIDRLHSSTLRDR